MSFQQPSVETLSVGSRFSSARVVCLMRALCMLQNHINFTLLFIVCAHTSSACQLSAHFLCVTRLHARTRPPTVKWHPSVEIKKADRCIKSLNLFLLQQNKMSLFIFYMTFDEYLGWNPSLPAVLWILHGRRDPLQHEGTCWMHYGRQHQHLPDCPAVSKTRATCTCRPEICPPRGREHISVFSACIY